MDTDSLAVTVATTQLLARYASCVDSFDLDGVAELFADDARFVVQARELRGRAEILRFLRSSPAGIHLGAQAAVRIHGDGRVTTVQNFLFLPDSGDGSMHGVYRDVVRLDRGAWRFSERRVEIRSV